MAKIPDGILRTWQDTETIHASEYNQEREIIRAAVNDNFSRVSSLESSTAAVQLGTAQLQKITSDTGDVKLSVTDIFKSALTELLALGRGMHTFYAVGGSKDLPPSNLSIRGVAHLTSDTTGWVLATDYNNNVYMNYCDNGKWTGWEGLNRPEQKVLWTGAIFMQAGQSAVPTKKISECRNGWVLVWSDYNPGQGAQGYDIQETFITKQSVALFPGAGRPFTVGRTPDNSIIKYINVSDSKLEGNAGNEVGDKNDVVLRYVLEW